jgi:spore coat-associated protein N
MNASRPLEYSDNIKKEDTLKKILGLTIAAILVIGMVGVGTWALFSDTEKSTDNVISAGTLDLQIGAPVDAIFGATGIKPGDYIPSDTDDPSLPGTPAKIALSNAGSIDGGSCNVTFSYADVTPSTGISADEFAKGLNVIDLHYGSTNLAGLIDDLNGNTRIDMDDLAHTNLGSLAGIPANGAQTVDFTIQVQLDEGAGNEFQGEGINITITFTLNQ